MPHDKHGNLLAVDDEVLLRCRIISLASESEKDCNVTLQPSERPEGELHIPNIALNSKFVTLHLPVPAPAPPVTGISFGEALLAMQEGKHVARAGWNGKNMYLWLLPAATIPAEWCKEPHLKQLAEDNGGTLECLASIRMKTADNKVLTGWLASQTDMVATDYFILP